MSTDAAPVEALAAAPAAPLTKSQKKRMKQKASKARKEAVLDAERAKAEFSKGAGSSRPKTLNSHEQLIHDVVALGFTDGDVSQAMEDMWELGLRYDDFETVVSYLESKAVQEDVDFNAVTEVATQSTAASTSTAGAAPAGDNAKPAVVEKDGKDVGVVNTINEEETAPDDVKPPPVASDVAATAGSQPASTTNSSKSRGSRSSTKKAAAAPVGMIAKLEMVSKFENISDAIFALTGWVTKAAKPQEITDFCDPQKCKALPNILRRIILEGTDSMGSVLDLIGSVLRASGVEAPSVSAVAKALGTTIVQTRSVVTSDVATTSPLSPDVPSNLGSAVADACVLYLGRAVEKLKVASQNSDMIIHKIEEEVDALASALPAATSNPGVMDLMTRRDCHKVAAEKYSTVAGIVVLSATTGAGGLEEGPGAGAGVESDGKQAGILPSLLGDTYDAVISNRSEYEELKVQMNDALASTRTEREALTSEREDCQSRKEEINLRLLELRLDMERLEKEALQLDEKISTAEDKLEELDRDCDDNVRHMKMQLEEKAKIAKLEDDARVVAEKLHKLEGALSMSCATVANQNDNGGNSMSVEKMSNKMGIYFARMRNYFKAEAEAVEFMAARADSLTGEIKDLEREIAECRSLGMATNVAQLNQTLKRTRRNMDDDNSVVTALRGEAEKMRDDLVMRLGEYKAASIELGAKANQAFSSLQMSVLTGIKDAMSRIGIEDGGLHTYLDSFVGEVIATPPTPEENGTHLDLGDLTESIRSVEDTGNDESRTDGDGTSTKGITGTVLPLQGPAVDSLPSEAVAPSTPKAVAPPPPPAPKFSWGAKTSVAKKPAVSLLEIQRQEQELLAEKKDDNKS